MPPRALQIAVGIMGVLIVAGVTVIIVTLGHRFAAAPARTISAAPLNLPQGAHIETIGVGADRLVLDLVLPDGNRQLLVIDIASGRRLGTIPLHASP